MADSDLRDELARERTQLANERTLLAYVRTSLAAAGGGVALAFVPSAHSLLPLTWLLLLGALVMLCIGVARHRAVRRRLRRLATPH